MTIIKNNILANFMGNSWTALMSLIFVPLYVKFIGIDAYGLVGFYAMIRLFSGALDLGLSSTINREMAKSHNQRHKSQGMANTLLTLEMFNIGIAFLIGLSFLFLSKPAGLYWFRSEVLSSQTIQFSIVLMGMALALQWPITFYQNGLLGLEKQILANFINVFYVSSRTIFTILILWKVSPTIIAFLYCQIFFNLLQALNLRIVLWKKISPINKKVFFKISLFYKNLHFSLGMSLFTLLTMLSTQIDKILLSSMLRLDQFGYYSFAVTIALSLYHFINPVNVAIFPKLTRLSYQNKIKELRILYHQGTQLVSVILVPFSAVLIFFSYEIIFLWSRNAHLASIVSPIATLLTLGTVISAFMNLPVTSQVAAGKTRIIIYSQIFFLCFVIPGLSFFVNHFGLKGAAMNWIMINSLQIILFIPLMHRNLLKESVISWYTKDIALPFLFIFSFTFLWKLIFPLSGNWSINFLNITTCLMINFVLAVFSTAKIRSYVKIFLFRGLQIVIQKYVKLTR